MSLGNQLIIIFGCFILVFLYLRAFISGIKRFYLNKSAIKKKKKEECTADWLFYRKYLTEIPKIILVLYYSVLIVHPICALICFLLHISMCFGLGETIAITLAGIDVVLVLTIAVLFWSSGPDYAYGRWLTKRRTKKDKR